jgi:hypothetical protein
MAYKFSSKSALRTLHDVSLGQTKPYRPGQGLSEENIVRNRTFARVWFLCNKRSASSENDQALRVLIGCVGIRQQSRASIQQTSDACMLWHRREGDSAKSKSTLG